MELDRVVSCDEEPHLDSLGAFSLAERRQLRRVGGEQLGDALVPDVHHLRRRERGWGSVWVQNEGVRSKGVWLRVLVKK